MGANVTKVEPPGAGDQTRRAWGFKMKGEDTAAFIAINRNKKSVTLNLKEEEGREIFYRLAQNADLLIENYRPGVAKRLGADYETLKEINPRLIYASISGFGQIGPYAGRAGYDLIAQGMSGVMRVTGEPGGPPAKCGVPIGDLLAGLLCAFAILTAHIAREETGRGRPRDRAARPAPATKPRAPRTLRRCSRPDRPDRPRRTGARAALAVVQPGSSAVYGDRPKMRLKIMVSLVRIWVPPLPILFRASWEWSSASC
jgi:hypothetical protein